MFTYFIFLFFFLEAVKLLLEIVEVYKTDKISGNINPDDVTFCISAFNESEFIYNTLNSIYPYSVIIGDDGSTDHTTSEIQRYINDYPNRNVILITKKNSGKVDTLKQLIKIVKTKYVVIADADIVLGENFKIPDLGDATGMSFNIKPLNTKTIISKLQIHEYNKSMDIGRVSKNNYQTVHCISGAMGLYRTDRLKRLSTKHKKNYEGEDLSRTLIELKNLGKIIHSDEIVYTDVPNDLKTLFRQRIKYWNPGLYFNLFNMINLIFKKHIKWRLRIEMLYEIISMILDPLKIISLFLASWWVLLLLYCYYVIFELIIKRFIKSEINYGLIFLYPFYNLSLLFTRILSIPKAIKMISNLYIVNNKRSYLRLLKIKTKSYIRRFNFKKVVFFVSVFLISLSSLSQTAEIRSESFVYNNQFKQNFILYGDYKTYYMEISTIQNQSITVGKWLNDGYIYAMYRNNYIKTAGKIQLDKYKKYPFQYFINYNLTYLTDQNKFVESLGGEVQYFFNDSLSISTFVGYENGYKNSPYIGERIEWKKLNATVIYFKGFEYSIGYIGKHITSSFAYENDYDFTGKPKYTLTIGYKFRYKK